MKTKQTIDDLRSDCCNGMVMLNEADEVIRYYSCLKCGKACDPCHSANNIDKTEAKPACLCAGPRRRNAGLCLKCEIAFLPTDFPDRFAERDYSYEKGYKDRDYSYEKGYKDRDYSYEKGYKDAKNDILRLLE